MKEYKTENIRNVAVVAHSNAGKSSLIEAILLNGGTIDRLGSVDEGNSVADYATDELERKMTINCSICVAEWKDQAVALEHVEITGSHSGTIHLNAPFAPIWYTWLCDGTGAILCKKAVEAAGGKFTGMFDHYCGPYRVKEWVQKQSDSL